LLHISVKRTFLAYSRDQFVESDVTVIYDVIEH